jgi:hypothetical protein
MAAMALERLQVRAAARILDLDSAVPGRGRQPGRVVREGYREYRTPMALERLQACAPVVAHSWLNRDPFRLFVLELPFNQTICWTEQQRRCICLESVGLKSSFVVHDKSMCIPDKLI